MVLNGVLNCGTEMFVLNNSCSPLKIFSIHTYVPHARWLKEYARPKCLEYTGAIEYTLENHMFI